MATEDDSDTTNLPPFHSKPDVRNISTAEGDGHVSQGRARASPNVGAHGDAASHESALSILVTSPYVNESNRVMDVVDTVEDILSYRFGLHPKSFEVNVDTLVKPSIALTALGMARAKPASSLHPLLQRFVTDPRRQVSQVDFARVRPPSLTPTVRILVKEYSSRVWDIFGVRAGACYVVESDTSGSVGWKLVVDDPVTAVLIIRHRWGPNLSDIGAELLKRGITFHTYRPRPINMIHIDSHHHAYVSWRSVSLGCHYGSLGLAADYCLYVNVRNRFLQETHACRAALLRGGITWRLAMDTLGYEYAAGEVLVGPSASCVDFGEMPQFLSDGTELWDHVLSDEELDLICGVYKAHTGRDIVFSFLCPADQAT